MRYPPVSQRVAGLTLLAAASFLPLGCGDRTPRIPVFPTGGTVLSAGRPAANAIIVFHPVGPTATPAGGQEIASSATETDEEGRYRLTTYMADDGAPAGDYVVTVLPHAPSVEDGDGRVRPPAVSAALARYTDPATSPFKASIKPGDNRFDFELK
jgi:hypothetical protein